MQRERWLADRRLSVHDDPIAWEGIGGPVRQVHMVGYEQLDAIVRSGQEVSLEDRVRPLRPVSRPSGERFQPLAEGDREVLRLDR